MHSKLHTSNSLIPVPFPQHTHILSFLLCSLLPYPITVPPFEHFWAVTRTKIPHKVNTPPENNQELPPFFKASTILGIPFISPSSHMCSPRVGHEGDKASCSNLVASSSEPSSRHPTSCSSYLCRQLWANKSVFIKTRCTCDLSELCPSPWYQLAQLWLVEKHCFPCSLCETFSVYWLSESPAQGSCCLLLYCCP